MLSGTEATLDHMLFCRERRANLQAYYINTFGKPVISYCMNIPGPIKTTPDILKLFQEGAKRVFDTLKEEHISILDFTEYHEITGDELILCVDCTEADDLKRMMISIEERHPLGRLFDMDVINTKGEKLSRSEFRKCLICGRQAQDCASSRRHSVEEMQNEIERRLREYR